jgi:hypothetical protein
MRLRLASAWAVTALLLLGAGGARAQEEATSAARTSAKEWLGLLDENEYGKAWQTAGTLVQAAVTEEEWSAKMSVTLGPLGKADSRAVRSSEYSTTMPGAPDGEWVVVKFDTTFEKQQKALETVIMRKEPDGTWKVSGYHIR